jgi:LDH2 family malate/lactate/ureidoglycolate dehydrogenase
MLGNGPMAVGIPAGRHDPVILDMSFTESSMSGVRMAVDQGMTLPPGVFLDEDGNPTTQPRFEPSDGTRGAVEVKGSLTPLGNGHKGYAILFVLGLLASALTGTDPAWELTAEEAGNRFGTLIWVLDPTAFVGDALPAFVDHYIDTLAASPRRPGVDRILYPGQRSQELQRERRDDGTVQIPTDQMTSLTELAGELGIPPLTTLDNPS